MVSTAVKMPDMASKKQNKTGRPATGRKPFVTLYVRVPPSLGEALAAYMDATEPRPGKNAVIETALRRFLESQGAWPPPDQPQR